MNGKKLNHNQFGSLKLIPLSKSEPMIKTPAITDTVLFIVINLILFLSLEPKSSVSTNSTTPAWKGALYPNRIFCIC
jgi:hypothetical protein